MTSEQVKTAAQSALEAARQHKHDLKHEKTVATETDVRVTWQCRTCERRVLAVWQRTTGLDVGGSATKAGCAKGA